MATAAGAAAAIEQRIEAAVSGAGAGWFSPAMGLWAAADYGRGEVEIDDDEAGRRPSGADLRTMATTAPGRGGFMTVDR